MSRLILATAIVLTGSIVTTSLLAQEMRSVSVNTVGTKEVRIAIHSNFDDNDCSGKQKPGIDIKSNPKNGSVSVKNGVEKVNRPASACHGKSVPGKAVFYKAKSGFKGKDSVKYSILGSGGKVLFTINATITVK